MDPEQEARFAAELVRETHKEVRDMEITWEETLAAREAKGIAQGKAEAIREDIVFVLTHRFGSTPPAVQKRLDAIDDLDRLRGILQQALSVDSIDDLDL